jgi:hypothetical protein
MHTSYSEAATKGGMIFKGRDDLLSATRYAVMMLRFAEVEPRAAVQVNQAQCVDRVTWANGWLLSG